MHYFGYLIFDAPIFLYKWNIFKKFQTSLEACFSNAIFQEVCIKWNHMVTLQILLVYKDDIAFSTSR